MQVLVANRVFDGDRFLGRAMVVIDGSRVVAVDTAASGAPEGAEVLDFGDATIMPGLVDAHIHLALDAGPDPEADEVCSSRWPSPVVRRTRRPVE